MDFVRFSHMIMNRYGNAWVCIHSFLTACKKLCKMTLAFDSWIALFKFIFYFISHPHKLCYIVVILLTNMNMNAVGEYKRIMATHVVSIFNWRIFNKVFWKWYAVYRIYAKPLLTIDCSNEHRAKYHVTLFVSYQEVIKCCWMSSVSLLYLQSSTH